ncbi:MAG: MATE family efflux transporter [Candidatus Faecousia sp.]|nr:MATE family efflux transporter [Bacillota bacterium]MDY4218816.1 MATE family efflux transporter [Candidatus Faecousia sp.]
MKWEKSFFRTVCAIAVPVALQSMLQSSFSVVDQVMIGQLGSASVSAIGLAGKFTSIFSVMVSAIATVAGIMMAQYLGQNNPGETRRSFRVNLTLASGLGGIFTLLCLVCPGSIMGLYTRDPETRQLGASYLFLMAGTFLPVAGSTMLATVFRCTDRASLPLYASLAAAGLNTGLNYVLIFGKLGVSPMGVRGAAIATLISQGANLAVSLGLYFRTGGRRQRVPAAGAFRWGQFAAMLLPVLVCELLWSLGENAYAVIYGHLGTQSSAAMTLINPVQSLMIGALCGLSQAAGILVGKILGGRDFEGAYGASRRLMWYGLWGSAALSLLLLVCKPAYLSIYRVEPEVKRLTGQILTAYALIAPFKVQNMILGGGILRSGGRTRAVMWIDLIGTWVFGVPLGLLAAFVWKLTVPYVYFLLSLEECVRFAISLAVFRRRGWMRQISGGGETAG